MLQDPYMQKKSPYFFLRSALQCLDLIKGSSKEDSIIIPVLNKENQRCTASSRREFHYSLFNRLARNTSILSIRIAAGTS
jgi:hypothetical protein